MKISRSTFIGNTSRTAECAFVPIGSCHAQHVWVITYRRLVVVTATRDIIADLVYVFAIRSFYDVASQRNPAILSIRGCAFVDGAGVWLISATNDSVVTGRTTIPCHPTDAARNDSGVAGVRTCVCGRTTDQRFGGGCCVDDWRTGRTGVCVIISSTTYQVVAGRTTSNYTGVSATRTRVCRGGFCIVDCRTAIACRISYKCTDGTFISASCTCAVYRACIHSASETNRQEVTGCAGRDTGVSGTRTRVCRGGFCVADCRTGCACIHSASETNRQEVTSRTSSNYPGVIGTRTCVCRGGFCVADCRTARACSIIYICTGDTFISVVGTRCKIRTSFRACGCERSRCASITCIL